MYNSLEQLRPYFYSLREIKDQFSLDLRLPFAWKYGHITLPYKGIKVMVQDKNESTSLVSLVAIATEEGFNMIFACADEIIKINKEEEEKRKLFEQKVNELKILFEKESLHKLKDINFLEHGQQDSTSLRMVGEGEGEGSIGDRETQDENNQSNQIA